MRIGELAAIAGVTVRTIRYYHQVGVLAEPPRRANGYRAYTVDHLVALLTIGQLTDSGLTLAQAGSIATDATSASAEEALDEVDRVLEAQIADLTEKRERLARARRGHHLGLSPMAAALSLTNDDAPIAILMAHLYRDHPQIDFLAGALLDPDLRSAVVSLQARFDAIDETTTDSELEDLAAQLQPIVASFPAELPALTQDRSQLVLTLVERDLNEQQRAFLRRHE